ncbi:MAG: BadF/BadG/BcrA/BcrD ATPase family protein [bacterium]
MEKNKIIIGFDIGTVKISWIIKNLNGVEIEKGLLNHNGNIQAVEKVINELREKLRDNLIVKVVSAGSMANLLCSPAKIVPEQAAEEEASKILYPELSAFNIIRLGGNGFSILTYKEGKFSFYTNDKCSSGTGTAIERLCHGRFGITANEACELAKNAKNPPKIAARCSVFIKSEITHLANQGLSREEILASYFNGIVLNILGLVKKWKVSGPVILIGGVAENKQVAGRLKDILKNENEVEIFKDARFFESIGAAEIALKLAKENKDDNEIDLSEIIAPQKKAIECLLPLSNFLSKVKKYDNKKINNLDYNNIEIILGLDLGSTGAKLALIEKKTGDVLYDDYTSTKGNPVAASQELIKKIPPQFLKNIAAVGITGSGRYTVSALFQAAYPELFDRVIVKTEIIAHAKSASKIDPDNGESLSVIEIGGQDAKYTFVRDGEVDDSIMNMACAAGTGSFLEEQGIFYKVEDIIEFGKLAYEAKRPANLGQHCTVFVAEMANKALQEGFTLPDIFAGFYYAVIYNYVNRVMGKRIFGKKIFLQGKPASNIALACALSAVTGKEVIVPPNPGAMGAIGIALCALDANPSLTLLPRQAQDNISEGMEQYAKYFDLNKFLEAKIISRSDFQCNNEKCGNLCRINMTVVKAGDKETRVLSGGMCPKYEQAKINKLPSDAPNPFRKREELLKKITDCYDEKTASFKEGNDQKTVGIPDGLGVVRFLPFFSSFFKELGLNIKVFKTDDKTMEKGDSMCSSYDTCAPIKIMHGLIGDCDYYFSPKIKTLPLIKDEEGSCTCPLVQGVPELVKFSLNSDKIKFINPVLDFKNGIEGIRDVFFKIAQDLKREEFFDASFSKAVLTQKEFENNLIEIGREALDYAAKNNLPVILVCGRLYTICNPILNSGIPQTIQESGAIALPIDCYPVKKDRQIFEIMYWGEGQRNLRAVLNTFEEDNIYPVWISNYICGPDSFLEHFFKYISKSYPHMNLETDGHSGTAGFVTRVEAFLHTCRFHMNNKQNKDYNRNLASFKMADRNINIFEKGSKFILPSMGDINDFFAAICRAADSDAISLPPVARDGFMLGRKDCSGKECLPFLCLWGSIKKYLLGLDRDNLPAKLIFLVPTTNGPCRFCMYHIRIKQLTEELLNELNIKINIEFYSPTTEDSYGNEFGAMFQIKMWLSVLIYDFLHDMLYYVRPIEKNIGGSEKVFETYKKQFIELLEKPSNNNSIFNTWGIADLMEEAASAFNSIEIDLKKKEKIIDVALAGEIYVRMENFANDELIKKLEKYGMRVKLAPMREWINYVGYCEDANSREKESPPDRMSVIRAGEYTRIIKKKTEKLIKIFYERKLYNICAKKLNWAHDHKISDLVKTGHPYIGDAPEGEAILTIGAPLIMYRKKEIKGAVIIGPYGCMPTKIAEAQLNRSEIPFISIFVDGEPIDKNKIANFAWQLGGVDSLR